MYQAPDFIKVSTKVKDVFAGYGSCPMEGYTYYSHGSSDCGSQFNDNTYIGLKLGNACYTANDPPAAPIPIY